MRSGGRRTRRRSPALLAVSASVRGEDPEHAVRQAHVAQRAGDPAVLDQERAVARHAPVISVSFGRTDVRVPEPGHVDAALDRARTARPRRPRRRPPARGWWGAGPRRRRRARARGRSDRAAAGQRGAAGVVHDRCATPSWISGSGALGTPSASNERGSVRGWRGESARLIGGAATALAEPPVERAAPLGVRQAVERAAGRAGRAAQPTASRLEHDRVLAGRQLDRLAVGERLARGALGELRARRCSPAATALDAA